MRGARELSKTGMRKWRTGREFAILTAGLIMLACAAYISLLYRPFSENSSGLRSYYYAVAEPLDGYSDPRLVRLAGESDMDFARRALAAVSDALFHCEDNSAKQSWLLRTVTALKLVTKESQGLLVPTKLRCGLCHQVAYILARALRTGGLEAEAFGLSGHVVTRAKLQGETYYLDADVGVGPFLGSDPNLKQTLEVVYKGATNEDQAMRIVGMYMSTADNQPYYSNASLDGISQRQARWLIAQRLLELVMWIAGAYLVTRFVWDAFGRRTQTAGPTSHPEPLSPGLPSR